MNDETTKATSRLTECANRYTDAWCSHDAGSVALCYSPEGSLAINGGPPAVGRDAITAAAQEFMDTFPDLIVSMGGLSVEDDRTVYYWTLTGTNSGPRGTGNRVRISGFEQWRFDSDGLIAESRGSFDSADYQRQLERGTDKLT